MAFSIFVGMERYSVPQCKKKGVEGDWCRASAVPEDRELYYPTREVLVVREGYTLFCPCAGGFSCSKNQCKKDWIIAELNITFGLFECFWSMQ